MKKLIYHIAATIDGFIAHPDGTIDGFIPEGDHVGDYLHSVKEDYDAVLMGRRTYEFGFQFGVTNPYPWMSQYVISRSMLKSPDRNVKLVSEKIGPFVEEMKKADGKNIYLCGGSELATNLLELALIDEVIIKLNPVIFGSGIPIFAAGKDSVDLELIRNRTYESGVLLLHYRIKSKGDKQ